MARDPMDTLRSILHLARFPGTKGEGEAAINRAVALVKSHGIPRSAVASMWPAGWDFDGKRIAKHEDRDAAFDEALLEDLYDITHARVRTETEMLDALKRATKGKYSADFLREALRRARQAMDEIERRQEQERQERLRRAAERVKTEKKERERAEAEKKEREKDKHKREQTRGAIGTYARDLLRRVYGGEPYSYGYILGRILDRYPNAKTTVASLRWYENEMRNQGIEVPRNRPAKG